MDNIFELRPGEFQDDYLYRLGTLKETGAIQASWRELTEILNEVLRKHLPPWDQSSWRKRYKRLTLDPNRQIQEEDIPTASDEEQEESFDQMYENLIEIKRERALLGDIRTDQNRVMRESARATSLQEIMRQEIKRYQQPPKLHDAPRATEARALYAMLSDIHYGIQFANRVGTYDSAIARQRVMRYAQNIVRLGFENNIDTVYVSLMGDMISGIIHSTIRLENREDLIRQIIGASELTAEFLMELAQHFDQVYVNSVPGNHSRVDKSFEDASRGERLDDLVMWYCKVKFENVDNVQFVENEIDPTIGLFEIMGKSYVSVHGDLDADLRASATRIQTILNQHVDYILAAHMHVSDFRLEHVGYIHNGSVCGSGDNYTASKRLYGPPMQMCMIVSENGVDSLHPIRLDNQEDV